MTVALPFIDLQAQYRALKEEIDRKVESVFDRSAFILGQEVLEFEQAFASFCEAPHCVGVANGTDAIHLSFRVLGIGPGDEVIVPAHTFVATAIGVMQAGARPVLVDVDESTFLIDTTKIEAAITPHTKAIAPVHLYGRACNMDAVMDIAGRYNLKVVEDTAQAHGARWRGKRAGTFGDLGTFSFYPGKNLGAYGDAGACVTSVESHAKILRALRNYGSEVKYHHPVLGFNSRLDTVQAAILGVKLPHLHGWGRRRWEIANRYNTELAELAREAKIILPEIPPIAEHVFHLYVIRVKARAELMKRLAEKGIPTVIHYPIPFHMQEGFRTLQYGVGSFPITEKICAEILSLPIYPEMGEEEILRVCDGVRSVMATL